jgi:tetratricopeptide (TPR) repeat protein
MIRHLHPFRLLLPLVVLAVPLQAQRSQNEGPTDILVYVTFENSRPVGEQLRVDLTNASGIPMSQGFTDSSGRVLFQVGSQGGYIVKVSGLDIKDGSSESFEVFFCPSHCSRQVFVRVKAKAAPGESTATQNTTTKSTTTKSAASSGNPAVTSAAELRVPDTARKAFDQGMSAWQKKDYQQAAERFETAVADYPEYDTAYNNLGVMYAHLGQDDKAMAAFRRSVELNDKNADADRNLARMLMRQKDYAQAEQLLKKALTVQAPDAATLTMLAITEIQNGQVDEALKDAQKVHGLPHAGYALVHYISGEVLEEKHQYTQATVEYTTYLRESPSGPEAAEVKSALERLSNSTAKATPNTQ